MRRGKSAAHFLYSILNNTLFPYIFLEVGVVFFMDFDNNRQPCNGTSCRCKHITALICFIIITITLLSKIFVCIYGSCNPKIKITILGISALCTFNVNGTVTYCKQPELVVNPITNLFYTTDGGNTLYVIDGATNTVVTTVPVGNYPFEVVVLS